MKTNHIDLSIVIPCFNEAKNISIVLKQLLELIKDRKQSIEIIVIDGGSTDNTPSELKSIFEQLPPDSFKLILKRERGGYGADIMQALSTAKGEVLAWTHADLQTDIKDILTAYQLFQKHKINIFIKGKRKNRRLLEVFFTLGMQLITMFTLKVYLSDINAQPKLFSRSFYEQHLKKGYPSDFSLDLYALYQAKKNNYKIQTIPVYFKKRLYGEAKGGGGGWSMRIKLIRRTLKYIFALKENLKN